MILALLLAQLIPIYGHRGMVQEAPENTLAAYRLCLKEGIGIEVDVRLTRDGVPVVIHDGTITRTTGQKGRVADLTLDEMRRLDAGSWFSPAFRGARVPTLQEVLELVREADPVARTRLVIDQKDTSPGIELKVLDLLRQYGLSARAFVLCSDLSMLARYKAADPEILTSAIVNKVDQTEALLRKPEVDIVWLSKHVPGVLSSPDVRRIHANGKRVVHFIADREEDRWRAAAANGIDGIVTDYAREAKAALHTGRP